MKTRIRFYGIMILIAMLFACAKQEPIPSGAAAQTVPEAVTTDTVPKTSAPADNIAEEPTAAPEKAEQEPAEEETPQPVETPVPVTDEQLDNGYLDAWFDDSVLVGDSLVAGLSGYVLQERDKGNACLGKLQLVSASALTLKKAMEAELGERTAELKLRSYYMTISRVVSTLEAKKLFIMLGVSDRRWYTAEELVQAYDTLITAVRAEHPDIAIYVHSIMPMIKDYAKQVEVTSEQNREVNRQLKAYCEEKGYTYLELSDLVRDEEGYLVYDYSANDYRFHLNTKGKKIWVRCLRECAREEYNKGIWHPEEKK